MPNRQEEGDSSEFVRPLAAFGFEGASARPLHTGIVHRTFEVQQGDAEYILQCVNPAFSPQIHANISAVTNHLRHKNITTIRLLEALDGSPCLDLAEGGVWRMMERIPGVTFDRCEDPDQARRASRLVADFHNALLDFEEPLAPVGFSFHEFDSHRRDLESALREHSAHPLAGDIERLAVQLSRAADAWQPPNDLPRRVVHGDLKFNNMLFVGKSPEERASPVALIDLDTLARLPLYYDWGDAWRSWCNRKDEDDSRARLNLDIFRASCEGLMGNPHFSPTALELDSLTHALERVSLELAIRYAEDALRERHWSWDADRYATAGEHNLARARGQFALHEQARETHGERARFLRG